ncbi:N-acetylmuramoyl-L-alanine amidase [Streptomyces sp. LP05-1]|uniref:N-acetylmuramoyl-L-alanine amidase n=1 Tax=Streptomyces pyxinae TaxID=2970734 RepID=A0ABT2CDC2_9ACTN|nr:N-acetylmuramoyl-L-alanine amidase [Streptomyces sp. LP05-1]MCS0635384.1 N-acetylmuramoyl-L-alanine amidase [Streptomyces sp. LP05-1]
MAWYPAATRMELQPESDAQPAIRPTQFILHSVAAPWTARRMYEYWRDSTNLESHFGLGYAGDLAQYIGTETRADSNYQANRRPDGTGAVSVETASNLQHTDPWTDQQIEQLVRLGVWLHHHHGIPLRVCRSASDPGYGYHRLFRAWSTSGTACPGDARVRQFNDEVFPGIVTGATGQLPPPSEEDPMPTVINETRAGGPTLQPGAYTLIPMAYDPPLLQGPCSYAVTAYATVKGEPGTRVQMRFHDLALATGRLSLDLPIDCGVIGPDGVLNAQVSRNGILATNEQLRVEIQADRTAKVDWRVMRALRWTP